MELAREELLNIYRKFYNPKKDRDSVIEAMAAAIDAAMVKLAEQEPIAYLYLHEGEVYGANCMDIDDNIRATGVPLFSLPCVSPTINKTACVSGSEESETQTANNLALEYKLFTEWCRSNPSFGLDSRLHTHSGTIDNGGYISDEKTRVAFAAWRAAKKNLGTSPKCTEGYALVPVEPDQALLISMACCLNHGFGLLDKEAQYSMLYDIEKLYNEVVGKGYYSKDNRERYLAMLADDSKYTGGK